MKKTTLLLFLFTSVQIFAQSKKEDILFLKSGGVIYGIIKEKTDKIKIQISGGSIMVYKMDEIDSIKQESLNKTLRRDFFETYYRKAKGYRNITEVQFTYGTIPGINYYYGYVDAYPAGGAMDDIGVSAHTINGYQVCPQFFIGGGVGMDRLLTFRETFIPLYVRFQSELLKKRITPYLFADGGYAFMVANQVNNTSYYSYYHRLGGAYMTLGAGVHIYTKGPLSYMIGLGYRRNYGEIKYGEEYSGGNIQSYQYKLMYQRLVASWGLTF
jgi:hypothetical protein